MAAEMAEARPAVGALVHAELAAHTAAGSWVHAQVATPPGVGYRLGWRGEVPGDRESQARGAAAAEDGAGSHRRRDRHGRGRGLLPRSDEAGCRAAGVA